VFVCAKPMSDLTLLSGLHHFCPRNWRSTLLSSVGRLYAFIVLVDAAAGRVTGRIFNVDSDDYSLREIRGGFPNINVANVTNKISSLKLMRSGKWIKCFYESCMVTAFDCL